jgi:hypothetical protein
MPNWCCNLATFRCPSKDICDKLLSSIMKNTWFETFAPLRLDKETHKNEWDYYKAIEVWNTKWTPCDIEILSCNEETFTIEVSFSTAWSPPTGVYKIMNTEFNIVIDAVYDEIGSEFFGRCIYENGEEVDNMYDFPSNLDELTELRKIIGSELDDYMSSTWEQLEEGWANDEDEDDDDEDDLGETDKEDIDVDNEDDLLTNSFELCEYCGNEGDAGEHSGKIMCIACVDNEH